MRLTLITLGMLLVMALRAPAQDTTGGLGVGSGLGANGGLGIGNGLGVGNASGIGLQSSGGLGLGSEGGLGIGGVGVGANGGLGTGLNLRTPGASGGLLPSLGVRAGGDVSTRTRVPGLDVSGSLGGSARLRARDRRTMSPEERRAHAGSHTAQAGLGARSQSLLEADLSLATRLSQIDRLRDHAAATNDLDMLSRADVLEQQARLQHAQRIRQGTSTAGPAGSDIAGSSATHAFGQATLQSQDSLATPNQWQANGRFGAAATATATNQAEARLRGAGFIESAGGTIQPMGFQAQSYPQSEGVPANGAATSATGQFHTGSQAALETAGPTSGQVNQQAQSSLGSAAAQAAARARQQITGSADVAHPTPGQLRARGQQAVEVRSRLRQQFESQFGALNAVDVPPAPTANTQGTMKNQLHLNGETAIRQPNGTQAQADAQSRSNAAAEATTAAERPESTPTTGSSPDSNTEPAQDAGTKSTKE